MDSQFRENSWEFKKRRCPKSLKIAFASLHFAKVSDFAKVDYSDYQSFL